MLCFQEKLRSSEQVPVPQTTTGVRDEYSKARELTLPKELGKLVPYLRYKGRPVRGRSDQGQPTVYQKHSSLPSRKTMYRE